MVPHRQNCTPTVIILVNLPSKARNVRGTTWMDAATRNIRGTAWMNATNYSLSGRMKVNVIPISGIASCFPKHSAPACAAIRGIRAS